MFGTVAAKIERNTLTQIVAVTRRGLWARWT